MLQIVLRVFTDENEGSSIQLDVRDIERNPFYSI